MCDNENKNFGEKNYKEEKNKIYQEADLFLTKAEKLFPKDDYQKMKIIAQ